MGSFFCAKILLAKPLLRWYLRHGLVFERVYQIVEYELFACFRRFGDTVSAARREGDADPDKAIIADTFKLLGNSSYGKTITRVDLHRDIKYCTSAGAATLTNDRRFRQLDVVVPDDLYEVALKKRTVRYALPIQIGYFVYQYARLRMMEFYYDFIAAYITRPLFLYCAMDTDSAYLSFAGRDLDDLLATAKREHYFRHRGGWFLLEHCDAHAEAYVRCRLAG